jgi:hypothetical protein
VNTYEPLTKTASQNGQSPEALVTQWVSLAVRQFTDDPLALFIGALRSQGSDCADHHDQYVGKAVAETMRSTVLENTADD